MPAVLIVNTAIDNTTSDAVLTLREAISMVNSGGNASAALGHSLTAGEANQISGSFGTEDTIQFDTGVLPGQTITLGSALPQISTSVTIKGLGADRLAISGNHAVRVFDIPNGVVVDLSGLTIEDGLSSSGAGILNYGTLNLTNSTLANNLATGSFAQGGGIWNWGVATVANSTFSGNRANANIGNFSTAHGGGIFNGGTLAVINSTLSGNQAIANSSSPQALGGAIFNGAGASAIINQSTLAGNLAQGTGGPSFVRGGGFYNSATASIANTIIAGNTADSAQDYFGGVSSRGHNLVGTTDQSSGWAFDDLLGVAPLLGPLANNGGPTLTLALLPGSPAINAGSNNLAVDAQGQPLTADQRGGAFARIVGSAVDIGALEMQPPPQNTFAFIDADGDKVVVKLTGPGQMKVTLVNGTAPIESIELSGTSATNSVLGISVKKKAATPSTPAGDGRIGLGSITGSSVRVVQAKLANLEGAGINMSGPLGTVTLADIKNGADIITTGGTATRKTKLTLGVVGDGTTIDLDNPVSTLTVKGDFAGDLILDVADVAGVPAGRPVLKTLKVMGSVLATAAIDVNGLISSVTANGFHGSLTAGGVGTFRVKGDLTADLTLNGVGVGIGKPFLNSLIVTGSVLGSDIRVAGNVNRVRAAAFRDSTIFAGYSGPNDGSGDFVPAATVNSCVITGEDGAFQNSHVIASSFKNVSLRSVDIDNDDTKFGFIADVAIGRLTIGKPVTSTYNSGDVPLVIDDFEVRVGTGG